MNPPKCKDEDYINFLIATPRQVSATEAARVQPEQRQAPAHDAFTRLLQRLEPDAETLWGEAQTQVDLTHGILVIDDSTLDKPYAKQMALVTRHWSGKHHAVVRGINLITLLWTEGDRHVPCDYRVFDKAQDHLTKNDHFGQMLSTAQVRGFQPACVVFDGWYAGLDNLRLIRSFQWLWLTRLKDGLLRAAGGGACAAGGTGEARSPGASAHRHDLEGVVRAFQFAHRDRHGAEAGDGSGHPQRRSQRVVLGVVLGGRWRVHAAARAW